MIVLYILYKKWIQAVILPRRVMLQAGEWVVIKGAQARFGVPCRCLFRCCPNHDGASARDEVPRPDQGPEDPAVRRTVYVTHNATHIARLPSIAV